MTNFQQFQLPDEPEKPQEDFVSSPNVLQLDKTLRVKKMFNVEEVGTESLGGHKIKVKEIASGDLAAYSIKLDDFIIAVTHVGTAKTLTLPKPSLAGFGRIFVVKDASGSALTTTITINPNGTELIDGDTSYVLSTNFGVAGLYTNGTNWFTA